MIRKDYVLESLNMRLKDALENLSLESRSIGSVLGPCFRRCVITLHADSLLASLLPPLPSCRGTLYVEPPEWCSRNCAGGGNKRLLPTAKCQ